MRMEMNLSEDQRRRLVSLVVRRVIERIESEGIASDSVPSLDNAGGVIPCAIPPPGSPRYASTLTTLEERRESGTGEAGKCRCGCAGEKK